MSVAVVTGSGGLVGSDAVRRLAETGYDVVGLENDMRARLFGPEASTSRVTKELAEAYPSFRSLDVDVRDAEAVSRIFAEHSSRIELVIHAAAQPSHDWASKNPPTDFSINAIGTLNLLEATRRAAPGATFVFLSTNKVYGDLPNQLPLEERETRFDLPAEHPYFNGVDTSMSLDRSTHSLFGVSKASADLMVQEYGRYFEMPTVCFRCGCVSGPSHAGAVLHGFLAYLMKCTVTEQPYTVLGHKAKQVRDNIHGADLAEACLAFMRSPRPAAVYNIGGGRKSNCSMLEAIEACERIAGRTLDWTLVDTPRKGDHRWWISDLDEFRTDYPGWDLRYDVDSILREVHDANVERWMAVRAESS